ncbi:hypothetical protein ANTQUA_LOCUS1162 [Anthophora quadrimaculata]
MRKVTNTTCDFVRMISIDVAFYINFPIDIIDLAKAEEIQPNVIDSRNKYLHASRGLCRCGQRTHLALVYSLQGSAIQRKLETTPKAITV